MTPLERMAKAIEAKANDFTNGYIPTPFEIASLDECREYARAALLVLAECDLSDDIQEIGAEAQDEAIQAYKKHQRQIWDRTPQLKDKEIPAGSAPAMWMTPVFRAICRAIAEEGKIG